MAKVEEGQNIESVGAIMNWILWFFMAVWGFMRTALEIPAGTIERALHTLKRLTSPVTRKKAILLSVAAMLFLTSQAAWGWWPHGEKCVAVGPGQPSDCGEPEIKDFFLGCHNTCKRSNSTCHECVSTPNFLSNCNTNVNVNCLEWEEERDCELRYSIFGGLHCKCAGHWSVIPGAAKVVPDKCR